MAVVFASPAGTGKTTHKHALMKHFGCTHVYDDGEGDLRQSRPLSRGTLILCQPGCTGTHLQDVRNLVLSRAEMNAAMIAVGGTAIWDENGKVLSA